MYFDRSYEEFINDTSYVPGCAYFSTNEAFDGGALFAFESNVIFGGTVVVFQNNSAIRNGGALFLYADAKGVTHLYMITNVQHLYFIGNRAVQGGAIGVLYYLTYSYHIYYGEELGSSRIHLD